jgi:branched-chain amino acid transport system substrate-binding protein
LSFIHEETAMLNRKQFSRLALASALALGLGVPGAAWSQAKEPVKIGLVSSKSGVAAQQGEEVMRGVKFAVEEANAKGGVDGRRVEVAEGDDEATPEGGRRVAEKLAREGHNLLIGPILSSISLAIVQNLDRWDAAYFNIVSKSDKLTGDTCRARALFLNHADRTDIAMINVWAKELKEQTFAVLAADYAWGRDSGESFKKAVEANGKKVPLTLYVPLGTKDFSPYIAQIKAANVDAVWVAETGRDAIAFVKQAEEFGLIPKTKLIGHALILNFIINATGRALEGTVGTTEYSASIDTPRNREFVAAWKTKFNRLPTDNEALGYHGTQVIFEGVKRSGSVKPEAVTKALRGAQIETLYGPAVLRAEDNTLMLPSYVARAKEVDGAIIPVIEEVFPSSIIPAPSPQCKM